MVFKNESDLKKFLLQKCKAAIAETQERVYKIIYEFVERFYADYDPSLYDPRTYQLFANLVKAEIISTENGFETKVWFDLDSFNYVTGSQPSGEQVVKTAAQGLHGVSDGEGWLYRAGNSGAKIWDDQLQAKALQMLVQELKAKGIPIKK